jgi:hypothetical protein
MYLPACAAFPCAFSQCLQNASFLVPFSCVRRLLQEYKINTLITRYFLKSFVLGKTFINQKPGKKFEKVLIKAIAEFVFESSEIFMIFVGIVIIFCIADSFGLALYLYLAKAPILKLIVL